MTPEIQTAKDAVHRLLELDPAVSAVEIKDLQERFGPFAGETVRVAGTSFRQLQCEAAAKAASERTLRVELIPEPSNIYDPNAIMVVVVDGAIRYHIGYIPKGVTSRVHAMLKHGALIDTLIQHIKSPGDTPHPLPLGVRIICIYRCTPALSAVLTYP